MGGVSVRPNPRTKTPRTVTSGRYASYWNTFLFGNILLWPKFFRLSSTFLRSLAVQTMNEISRCPVCLEEYSDSGDLVPRLLPCSHTLCQGCIRRLLARGRRTLTCPEDRARHQAPEDKRSFAENRYVLQIIRQQQRVKPKFEMCPDHGRECSLYCSSSQCQRQICQLCLIKEHRHHDWTDLEQTRQEFCDKLLKTLDGLSGVLMDTKESLTQIKEAAFKNAQDSIRGIEKTRGELTKQFDVMIQKVQEESGDAHKSIEKELKVIDDTIVELQEIKGSTDVETDSHRDVTLRLGRVEQITWDVAFKFSANRLINYPEYRDPLPELVTVLCGRLIGKRTEVRLPGPVALTLSPNYTVTQIKSTGKIADPTSGVCSLPLIEQPTTLFRY